MSNKNLNKKNFDFISKIHQNIQSNIEIYDDFNNIFDFKL